MSNHSFGPNSLKQYNTLHNELQLILDHAIIESDVDFSLVEGYRSPETQFEFYKKGRTQTANGDWIVTDPKQVITNVDGYKIIGTHSYSPSIAVDIAIYVPGKPELTYDKVHLAYVAGVIMTIANRLFEEGKIKNKLRWGGNWDRDGDLKDNTLYDEPHFELIKP